MSNKKVYGRVWQPSDKSKSKLVTIPKWADNIKAGDIVEITKVEDE